MSQPSAEPAMPITAWPAAAIVKLYQLTLRPFMGGHCRFQPTCSDYSLLAYRRHGLLRGTWLTVRRIGRCHPWGGAGFDDVPPRG
ncbi:MAG: membrane protein insertion efficiency factor YidD [Phycisphaerales bacterium]